jgi:hypothetical protein
MEYCRTEFRSTFGSCNMQNLKRRKLKKTMELVWKRTTLKTGHADYEDSDDTIQYIFGVQ